MKPAVSREQLEAAAKQKKKLESLACREADLSHAKLFGLQIDLLDARQANLTEVDLRKAGLVECDFAGAVCPAASFAGATMFQCKLTEARGERAIFSDMHAEVNGFDAASLPSALFRGSLLSRSTFCSAQLDEACFDQAVGETADFTRASLVRASFRGAQLKGARFSHASLREADLSLADVTNVDFRGANLAGATFLGARIDGALFDGAPPAVSPAAPAVDRALCARAYLIAGDGESALALLRRYPEGTWIMNALDRSSGDNERLDARASTALLRTLLGSKDLELLHNACRWIAGEARRGRRLDLGAELTRLLDAETAIRKGGEGTARAKADPGLQAALALGYLGLTDALRVGMDGKGKIVERCAAGLAVVETFSPESAQLSALVANDKRAVRSGVVAGLAERIEAAGWDLKAGLAAWGELSVAIDTLNGLTTHSDAKLAKLAQRARRDAQTWIALFERTVVAKRGGS